MVHNDIIIVVGVSGVGKTTIGQRLAEKLQIPFFDADDFHPIENTEKMESGTPLQDEDRWPWLKNLNKKLEKESQNKGCVLACSALKEIYRSELNKNLEGKLTWVILQGDFDLIKARMESRDHFMPVELLASQFEAWEEPVYGIKVNVENSAKEIVNTIIEKLKMKVKADIGLIGLGVMGKSLSRNIASRGYNISVFNRHVDGKEEDVARNFVDQYDEMSKAQGFDDLKLFVDSLETPKKIFLMVNAGGPVDQVINNLKEYLQAGDLIIDGGNSHFKDTQRRFQELEKDKILFIGTGVSGGEEGALKGPSIMPGGSEKGFDLVGPILKSISAKDTSGTECCAYIGRGGSGHFVKMVHNGIEYAEMQLIAEVYAVLRYGHGKTHEEISEIFGVWLQTDTASYLLEITADILKKKEGEKYLLDLILDKAGNKGTGSWTTIAACELGVAIPTLTAALFARYQSAVYDERQSASEIYASANEALDLEIEELQTAYQLARIINHHQGFDLIAKASEQYNWDINYRDLSRIWTNGCIIRSKLMEQISQAPANDPNILMSPSLNSLVLSSRSSLNKIVSAINQTNISAPCFSSTLNYLNGYVEKRSLANVIQAQRDYFGAHTYERIDKPRGEKFHTEWI